MPFMCLGIVLEMSLLFKFVFKLSEALYAEIWEELYQHEICSVHQLWYLML